jgi:hypothetical protein
VCCCLFAVGFLTRASAADTSTVEIDVSATTVQVIVTGPPDDPGIDYVTSEDSDRLGRQFEGLLTASLGALTPWASSVGFGSTDVIGRSSLQVSTVHSATASNAPTPSTFAHEGRVLARWQSSSIRFTKSDGSALDGPEDVTLWCVFKSELAEVGIPVCSTREVGVRLVMTGASDRELSGSLDYRRSQIYCPPFPSSATTTINASGVFAGGSSTMNKTVTVPVRFTVEPGRDSIELDLISETVLWTDSFGTSDAVTHLLSFESFINIGNAFRPSGSGGISDGVFDVPPGITANSADGRIVNNGYVADSDPSCSPADLAEPFGQLTFADVGAFSNAFTVLDPAADLAEPFGQLTFADVGAFLAAFQAGCP